MYQQSVKARQLSPKQGALLILAIVAGVLLANVASEALYRATGLEWGSTVVWLAVAAAAVAVMKGAVVDYRYTCADGTLYLERKLGEHAKIVAAIPLKAIREIGDPDALRKAHPSAVPVEHAHAPKDEHALRAVLYVDEGKEHLALFQPDDKLLTLLGTENGDLE